MMLVHVTCDTVSVQDSTGGRLKKQGGSILDDASRRCLLRPSFTPARCGSPPLAPRPLVDAPCSAFVESEPQVLAVIPDIPGEECLRRI